MNTKTMFAVVLLGCAALLSSAVFADPAKVKQVEDKAVIVFPDGARGRPSYLNRIKANFDSPGAKIGELQQGLFCGKTGDILWNQKVYGIFSSKLARTFRKELEAAHYPVPQTSDAIFEESKDKAKTDESLQVGMLIKEIAANFCANGNAGIQGGVYMKVFWQVYAPEMQKVVFETTTEGSFQPEGWDKTTLDGFFDKAFAAATRNLLADQGFSDAITGTAAGKAKPTGPEALKLKAAKATNEPLAKNVTLLRSAVTTVFGDSGSGSGFFVSTDGYLLTNRHVVGNSRFVKVRLPTGRELVGEVVRSDRARDVALIKTEPIGVHPMPVRASEPNVGEDVFALGSPLGDKFNTTLTKGILSGYRNIDDNRYLQSDVAILPGNSGGPLLDHKGSVIGITVAGLGSKGIAGMNFFIPINEALSKLGVKLD